MSSLPPPAPTAIMNSTLENATNNNSTLQSLTTPPPAALSSSPASSHTSGRPMLTQNTGINKSSTTNWIYNDDKSNGDNYTYTSGLVSSPLVLPVGNTHTTSTGLSASGSGSPSSSSPNSPTAGIQGALSLTRATQSNNIVNTVLMLVMQYY